MDSYNATKTDTSRAISNAFVYPCYEKARLRDFFCQFPSGLIAPVTSLCPPRDAVSGGTRDVYGGESKDCVARKD